MRYTVDIDLEAANTSQALAVLSIDPGSSVLDVGAADGSVAKRLVERGCHVVAVEADAEAAALADRFADRVIIGDVESMELETELDGAEFDTVLLLDVLEHLRDPLQTLQAAARRAKPGGRVIVSVPNVTHAALRLQLLGGQFSYTEHGLLDRTHLRFFDRASLEDLFARAGLTVIDRLRVQRGVAETEIDVDLSRFPPDVLELALGGEDADTYQFVYVAIFGPEKSNGLPSSLGEALQRRAEEIQRAHAEVEGYARSLEAKVADLEQVAARAAWLEEQLTLRLGELDAEHEKLKYARLELALKDEQLGELQAEFAPIRKRVDQLEQTLGYARHRAVEKLASYSKRVPALHRLLKRAAEAVARRQR